MKKKMLCFVGIAVALLICLIAYFRPLPLSDTANRNIQIKMILSDIGIRNGEAYIDPIVYQDLTAEQNEDVLSLLDAYTYRRTLGTLFSDGAMSGLGNKTLNIYIYDDTSLVGSIFIASSGKIAVNGKNYSMKNAEQFIEQIIEIME